MSEPKDLGAFQVLPQSIGDRLVLGLVVGLLIFGVLPDVLAWVRGAPPVGICR